MKALLYTKPYTFEYMDVPDPEVGDDDVLVRVKACGICGSDVAGHTGKTGRRLPPLIMGHEAAGVVERTGRNVRGFAPGERRTRDDGPPGADDGARFEKLSRPLERQDPRRVLAFGEPRRRKTVDGCSPSANPV